MGKSHAALGASSASIWMQCAPAGRALMSGMRRGTSVFAEEGTVAHDLAEACIILGGDPGVWVGRTLGGFEVTTEMANAVRIYVDVCRDLMPGSSEWWSERQVSLAPLAEIEGVDLFGTADFSALSANGSTLTIADLKYGAGVSITAKDSPQLRYYAAGVLAALDERRRNAVDTIELLIVQPRVRDEHGPVRRDTLSQSELLAWLRDELVVSVELVMSGGGDHVPGSHCRFCVKAQSCPGLAERAQSVAKAQFGQTPPRPDELTPDEVADVLLWAPVLTSWLARVRGHASDLLDKGHDVPGFKLVERRSVRAWAEGVELNALAGRLGLPADGLVDRKPVTVAEAERRAENAGLAPTEISQALDGLVTKDSSGTTIVPVSDRREAVPTGAAAAFSNLSQNGENTDD